MRQARPNRPACPPGASTAEPTSSARVVEALSRNEQAVVPERRDGWAGFTRAGGTCWVSEGFLERGAGDAKGGAAETGGTRGLLTAGTAAGAGAAGDDVATRAWLTTRSVDRPGTEDVNIAAAAEDPISAADARAPVRSSATGRVEAGTASPAAATSGTGFDLIIGPSIPEPAPVTVIRTVPPLRIVASDLLQTSQDLAARRRCASN